MQLFRPRRGKNPGSIKGTFRLGVERAGGALGVLTAHAIRWVSPAAFVLRAAEIQDRTAAEALKGAFISIDPDQLPEALADAADHVFGAVARAEDTGRVLGRVIAVEDNGAQALLVIETPSGTEVLVPCVEALVRAPVREGDTLVVSIAPVSGLFDASDAAESEAPSTETGNDSA